MKKSTKIWLGLATIWPILYIFLFIGVIVLGFIVAGFNPGPQTQPDHPLSIFFPLGFMAFFVVHMLTILGSLALTVFYIIRIFKTEQLDQNMKIMWTLLLFFMGMLAQPVFWYLYIWKEAPGATREPSLVGAGSPQQWSENSAREAEYFPPRQPPDWR